MSAGTIIESENFKFWFDGQPSINIQKPSSILGNMSYWFDGEPYATVFPPSVINNLNGGFFLFMGF